MKMQIIPEPKCIQQKFMNGVVKRFKENGYTYQECAKRLGVDPFLGVPFNKIRRPTWQPDPRNGTDMLISLFIDGNPIPLATASQFFPASDLDHLAEMSLIEISDTTVRAPLSLFPCFDHYIVTDPIEKNPDMNQVMWLFAGSFIFGTVIDHLLSCKKRDRGLDLCTGAGVHALIASSHCREVIGIDNNPRAVAFANFSKALNDIGNVEFLLGDVYKPAEGEFDAIVSHPPYIPDAGSQSGSNFWSGGATGNEIVQRIITELPRYLEDTGICLIFSIFPDLPGHSARLYFDQWLAGRSTDFDILDSSLRMPGIQNTPYVEKNAEVRELIFTGGIFALSKSRHGGSYQTNPPPSSQSCYHIFAPDGKTASSTEVDMMNAWIKSR
ncbi:MAG: class I SAM-dependent methyltransferase [Magnetococcales bacterium]|nr:class I SAM-dependent methyltransferase [Magnetococcales bacterium]